MVRERDGFALLRLDGGNGDLLQPIDVRRLVDGENPTDAFYAALDAPTKKCIDAQVDRLSGQADTKFILASKNAGFYHAFRHLQSSGTLVFPPVVMMNIVSECK